MGCCESSDEEIAAVAVVENPIQNTGERGGPAAIHPELPPTEIDAKRNDPDSTDTMSMGLLSLDANPAQRALFEWLKSFGLGQHFKTFVSQECATLEDIVTFDSKQDLAAIGIPSGSQLDMLWSNIQRKKDDIVDETYLRKWLKDLGIEYCSHQLVSAGYTSLDDMATFDSKEELKEDSGVTKNKDLDKFWMAVQQLKMDLEVIPNNKKNSKKKNKSGGEKNGSKNANASSSSVPLGEVLSAVHSAVRFEKHKTHFLSLKKYRSLVKDRVEAWLKRVAEGSSGNTGGAKGSNEADSSGMSMSEFLTLVGELRLEVEIATEAERAERAAEDRRCQVYRSVWRKVYYRAYQQRNKLYQMKVARRKKKYNQLELMLSAIETLKAIRAIQRPRTARNLTEAGGNYSEEQIAEMEEAFNRCDSLGNGSIIGECLGDVMRDLRQTVDEGELREIMNLDLDVWDEYGYNTFSQFLVVNKAWMLARDKRGRDYYR